MDAIDLRGVKANTGNLIEGMEIKGTLGKLYAKADRIDLGKEIARLNKIDLSDTAITLLMNDTTTNKDTTSTAVNWKLMLDQIDLDRVAFAMQMPGDSLRLSTYIDKAGLTDGIVDLGSARYSASQFLLSGSSLSYDGSYSDPAPGFDPAHIALNDVNIRIDSLLYGGRDISARIKKFSANDRSGLTLSSLTGDISSDSTTIQVPGLLLKTPYSEIRLLATVPWNTFDNTPSGTLHSLLTASVGKRRCIYLCRSSPQGVQTSLSPKRNQPDSRNRREPGCFTAAPAERRTAWHLQSEYHRRNESRGRQYPPFG